MSEPEKLAPEREIGPRLYTVLITEHAQRVVHEQNWIETHKDENGRPVTGYRTIAKRVKSEREIFRGEFMDRPQISALAKLMEGEQP